MSHSLLFFLLQLEHLLHNLLLFDQKGSDDSAPDCTVGEATTIYAAHMLLALGHFTSVELLGPVLADLLSPTGK